MLLFRSSLSSGGGGTEPGKFDTVTGDISGIAGTVTLTEFELQEVTSDGESV